LDAKIEGKTDEPSNEAMSAKILIVEDDPDMMRILAQALTGAGYQVIHGFGGEDALRKAKDLKPDLVVTDLSMPQVSGVAVIQMIKNNPETRHIRVIAVTAHVWDSIAKSAGSVGCDAFIGKPFSTKRLIQEVQNQLAPSAPQRPERVPPNLRLRKR
jgi:two-component system cell cycle response regulator DivK